MVITEPATMLTDYLITLVSWGFAYHLHRRGSARAGRLWAVGFLSAGAAALAGGTFHGFAQLLPGWSLSLLWDSAMLLIGLSAGFMIAGTYIAVLGRGRRWLIAGLAVTGVGLALLALKVSPHPAFNQNDLYHCIQLVAFYCFFRGAGLIEDPAGQG